VVPFTAHSFVAASQLSHMKNLLFAFVLLLACFPESQAQFWAKSNGRFGIGDENAIAKLQVNATSSFSNPGIALLDSSATNTSGGILQFRSINWDDNHFNMQAKIGEYASGQDSKLDFFFRENLIMSIEGGSTPDRQLLYNPRDGIFRTGFLNPGAKGQYSVAMGYNNLASGYGSVAFGSASNAIGDNSTVLGGSSTASGGYSTTIGYNNMASGPYTFAAGKQSSALEVNAIALGDSAVALGTSSHAIGYKTLASAHSSTATGHLTDATGLYSFSGGYATQATNTSAVAFGFVSQATGVSSSAFGYNTLAGGENSFALNSVTKALGHNSLTAGFETKTIGWGSSAFGDHTTAGSYASAVFGAYNDTIATSDPNAWVSTDPLLMVGNGISNVERNNAFTIYKNGSLLAKHPSAVTSDPGPIPPPVSGAGTRLMWMPEKGAFRVGTVTNDSWDAANIGRGSFVFGYNSKATGQHSFVAGAENTVTNDFSTAMGLLNEASGWVSTALGSLTVASGDFSTALGDNTLANGYKSVAMGSSSEASGITSVSMGTDTEASGDNSVVMGVGTKASAYASFVVGRYNDTVSGVWPNYWNDTDPLVMIGNGQDNENRHNTLTIYKNGNLMAKNRTTVTTDPGSLPMPVSGAGTRMIWIPEKSAFRAGTVNSDEWDSPNVGAWSLATGVDTKASGDYSTAFGWNTEATGFASTAIGQGTIALGSNSTAMGFGPDAIGNNSTAMGSLTEAIGNNSTSLGLLTSAQGASSTAMGVYTVASGDISTSMGSRTEANAYASTAIGSYNDVIEGSNMEAFVTTDPVFYVGNGVDESTRSNAMVVYKNGNTDINGYTRLGKESESAPRIKMKELPITFTGVNYNSSVSIPHGVTASKILSVSVLVEWDTDLFAPPEYSPSLNLRYNYYVNASSVVIQNNTPSGDCLICEKVARVTITYKE
jgi:autotransporter adhesin